MKNRIWLLQIPLIALMTFAFYIVQQGEAGKLHNEFLRTKLFPSLRSVTGTVTNMKFKYFRGPQEPKNKIVIVGIDSNSIEQIGRWPWHRDVTAFLVDKIFQAGAKVVGLDIVFSETEERVPNELISILKEKNLGQLAAPFDADGAFASMIAQYNDKLVLGWTTDTDCQPGYLPFEECPVTDKDAIKSHPEGYDKFAYTHFETKGNFDPQKTPLISLVTFIPNIHTEPLPIVDGINASPDRILSRMVAWPSTPGVIVSNGKALIS